METIDYKRVAIKSMNSSFSPYGYLISEDGMIYSLTEQYTHGTLLAILFPEIAKDKGYEAPTRDFCVFEYQRFELDNQDLFPIIRISIAYCGGMLNISKGENPITDEQRASLSKVFKEQGVAMNNLVSTEMGIMTASSSLRALCQTKEEYSECL